MGNQLKIAMFHELNFGGAKRVVMEFARRLRKIYEIDLYYVNEDKDNNIEDFFNKTYYYKFDSKIWKGNNWKVRFYMDTIELFKLYKLHKKISQDLLSKKYDYVFVHPSKYTQAPFILNFLGNICFYFCQEPLRMVYDPFISSNINDIAFPKNIYEFMIRKMRKWIDYKNLKSAKIILANSYFSKELIEKSYRSEATVCYLGVDEDLFRPLRISKSVDILFIGKKDEGYNLLSDSLKFFKTKPRVHTILRERRTPKITDGELVKIYNKSKILIALNRNEPFGLIPLEAMSCGIPVVAVSEGGYKESIISGKTGYLVKSDPKNLAEAILKLLNDDKLRYKMEKQAREHILENWTWDKSIKRFLEILANVK